MKITVNTFGTRGDVQPYIALSLGLRAAGHTVRILTHQIFEPLVRAHGLDLYPLTLDPRQVVLNEALSELGNNTLRITRWMEEHYQSALHDLFEATLAAGRGADLLLNSGLSFAGWHVAEKLDIPALAAYLWPVTPSHHMPTASGSIPPAWLPIKGTVNYWSTKLSNQLFFFMLSNLVNQCRADILNLPPMKLKAYWPLDSPAGPTVTMYGYSPSVAPKPPDWTNYQQITGYWFLDAKESYQPAPELLSFLAAGPPPVYVGFGSMVDHEGAAITELVVDALQMAGQRGFLLGGWGELGAGTLPDTVFQVDAVPHDWLFPQMAAVVHHGGAGTTAAALRAGVPNVVVPWFGDQFFWGWRVADLGAGPDPIPRKKLTTAKLAAAIRQAVTDRRIREGAAQVGQMIRAEDGISAAVRTIERFTGTALAG